MRALPPNWRAAHIEDGGTPRDDLEEQYQKLLLEEPDCSDAVVYATSIYGDVYKCEVVEAFLLAEVTPEEISVVLRMPLDILSAYEHLFFDRTAFKDELDVEAYAQTYDQSEYGKELKVAAITLGPEYLKYKFSRGKLTNVNIIQALQGMLESAYVLSAVTRLNPMNSEAFKEARQWMKAAMQGMDTYIRIKPVLEEHNDEFKTVLESIDRTTNAEKNPDISPEDLEH